MAKRFTDSEKFKDIWYRKLTPKQKCIWEFLLSECNCAGIIELDLEFASFVIGEKVTEEDMQVFDSKMQYLEKDLYFIPNFISFQYGTLSKSSKPHIPVIKLLEKYGLEFELLDENGFNSSHIRQRITNKTRQEIFIRDKFECQYCGSRDELEIDHITPVSRGGTNENDNLITACHRCNELKSNLLLDEFINKYKDQINFLDRVSKILDTLKEKEKEKDKDKNKDKEKEKEKDKYCNPDFEKCFKIYSENCKNLIPLSFERRSREVIDELSNFLNEIDYDMDMFSSLCRKANDLKVIVKNKIDFRSMIRNYIGIMNGKYSSGNMNKSASEILKLVTKRLEGSINSE